MGSAWAVYGFYGLELVVPFLLARLVPRPVRLTVLVAVGLACYAAVCVLAYRSSLVENGGDSTGGAESAALVGFLNAIVFLPLWSVGALLGSKSAPSR